MCYNSQPLFTNALWVYDIEINACPSEFRVSELKKQLRDFEYLGKKVPKKGKYMHTERTICKKKIQQKIAIRLENRKLMGAVCI